MVNAVLTSTELIIKDSRELIEWEYIIHEFETSNEIFEKMTDAEKYPDFAWSYSGWRIHITQTI